MRLPYLRTGNRVAAMTDGIGGLHLTEDYQNGQLEQGSHLSFDAYPGLGTRKTPAVVGRYEKPQAMFAKGGLLIVCGGHAVYDGEDLGVLLPGPKQMAAVNKYILIFPDKKYIDTEARKMGEMEISCTVHNAKFSGGTLTAAGIDWPFRAGDAVAISGCTARPENEKTLIIRTVGEELTFDDNAFEEGTETTVTLTRKVPDLEVVCEAGNRLWGCAGHTIYGSKLGDPFNFFVYDGLSTDSYSLAVSGEGPFTGCSAYGSYILFFRTDTAFKLYGTRPANYQLMTVRISGVRKDCAATMWTDSEDLYYMGAQGVYAYSGGIPTLLSAGLGDIRIEGACGCVWMGRYYLSAMVGGRKGIYTFDIRRQAWLPWGEGAAVAFAVWDGMLYILMDDGQLLTAEGGTGYEDWEAAFRPLQDGSGRNSRCTSVAIDASPEAGAWFALEICEHRGCWQRIALFDSRTQGPRPVRLPPNRGMRLQLRIVGHGPCRIRSIERRFRTGSEIS